MLSIISASGATKGDVTKGQVVCHAEVAEDSLDEAKRRAKTHAQERNAERPDRQSPKDRGLEL